MNQPKDVDRDSCALRCSPATGTKSCCMCEKELRSAMPGGDWATMQPYGGGEIMLHFGYGSTKFDNNFGGTCFNGVICDECTEKMIDRLKDISNA